MSDAISEIEKETEQARLSKINHSQLINDAKTYFSFHKENYSKYLKCKNDLIKLGYVIEEDKQLKIYKEF